jgi:peroxiredoxin (alkyl hydroperoxide reductase subunit C)
MSLLNTKIRPFTVQSYHAGKIETVTEADLAGRWAVLFFYPADFSTVCPTELYDLQDHYAEFSKAGAEVYSVSTDSELSHQAWAEALPMIGAIQYPMLADRTRRLATDFDCLIEATGVAERATFLIDPAGAVKAIEKSDGPVARKAEELVRKLRAAQFVAATPGAQYRATWAIED